MRYAWTVESVRRVQQSGEKASKIRLGKEGCQAEDGGSGVL